jgi:transcriptional regulator with XRE-family HTH domain
MAELAKKVGVSQQSICSIERQETKQPAASTMLAIASALGVPINKIMPSAGTPVAANEFDAVLSALDVNNRAALLTIAAVLLEAQKNPK